MLRSRNTNCTLGLKRNAVKSKWICILPSPFHTAGELTSFHTNIESGLEARDMNVVRGLNNEPYHAALVIKGMHQLATLYRRKWEGMCIVQPLGFENRPYGIYQSIFEDIYGQRSGPWLYDLRSHSYLISSYSRATS